MNSLRNRLFGLTVVCLLLACASTTNSSGSDLEKLLDQLIVAYGGEKNLRKLNSHVQEWQVFTLVGGNHGTDARRIRVPDQLKVELTYPHKQETRLINGQSGYVTFREGPAREATQPQRDAMRLQLMRLYSPLVLRDKLDSLTLETQGEFHVITLFEHGVRVDYFVNTDSWRIERVLGSLAFSGSEMQFLTEYSNFAFRDGVLVHLEENKFAGGVNTAVLQLRHITLDADLTEADFSTESDTPTPPEQERNDII